MTLPKIYKIKEENMRIVKARLNAIVGNHPDMQDVVDDILEKLDKN